MSTLGKFNIVFEGTVKEGFDRDSVVYNIAGLFNANPSKIEKLLSGKRTKLKKQYEYDSADKIYRVLNRMGVDCRIVEIQQKIDFAKRDATYSELQEQSYITMMNSDITGFQNLATPEYSSGGFYESFFVKNFRYYQNKFKKFRRLDSNQFFPTWHWPAFFCFPLWAAYRRHLFASTLVLVITLVFLTFFPLHFALPLIFGLMLFLGLTTNYWLYKHSEDSRTLWRKSLKGQQYVIEKGGVSKWSVLVPILVSCVLFIGTFRTILSNNLEYFNFFQNASLVSNHAGSLRDNLNELIHPQAFKTRLKIRELAAFVAITANKPDSSPDKMNAFLARQRQEGEEDQWKNPFEFRLTGNGVEIRSAGEDGVSYTEDDIHQRVPVDFSN